jgi:hypothetical protein
MNPSNKGQSVGYTRPDKKTLVRTLGAVASTDAELGDPSRAIAHAGEKLGSARKDQWTDHGLTIEDLDGRSAGEVRKLLRKSNIWQPDYAASHRLCALEF